MITLEHIAVLSFSVKRPFSFERTFYKPSHFKTRLELYNGDEYFVTMQHNGSLIGVRYAMASEKLSASIFSYKKLKPDMLGSIREELYHRLSLGVPVHDFHKEFKSDRWIKDAIKRNTGKRIVSIYSLYENLMISTFLQNATVQRTTAMCHNMLEKYGHPVAFGGVQLFALWRPEELVATEAELKELKVGYRAKAISRITQHFASNHGLEHSLRSLATPDLEKQLMKIYGVGKQTVLYSMLGQFHRMEYLKHIPLWERRILSRYIFNKELCDEQWMVKWFQQRYHRWCGYAISLVFEDVFHQHQKERFAWLDKLLRKEESL